MREIDTSANLDTGECLVPCYQDKKEYSRQTEYKYFVSFLSLNHPGQYLETREGNLGNEFGKQTPLSWQITLLHC